jgi:hypothetical protein
MTTEQKKMVYSDPWLELGRDLNQLMHLGVPIMACVELRYVKHWGSSEYQIQIYDNENWKMNTAYLMGLGFNSKYEMGEYEELDREIKWLVINAREAYKTFEKARDDEMLRRVGSLPLEKK